MTSFFNRADTLRSITSVVFAVLMGGIFLAAAAGPAVAAQNVAQNSVNFAANSNIIRSA